MTSKVGRLRMIRKWSMLVVLSALVYVTDSGKATVAAERQPVPNSGAESTDGG